MKKLATLLLLLPGLAQADPAQLAHFLRQDGVKPQESKQFLRQVDLAGRSYRGSVGKLSAQEPLPKPIEELLTQSGELIKSHHLKGDQALELLGAVLVEVNPKLSAASPTLAELQEIMRQHRVPGSELYSFLEPSVRQSITARLHGEKPHTPGFRQLQQATNFANQYGIPTQQLVTKLQQLRTTMNNADETP